MNTGADIVYAAARVPKSLVRDEVRFGGFPDGDCFRGDLVVRAGRIEGMSNGESLSGPVIGVGGQIILPRLVEAHCHLDKCHTFPRLPLAGNGLADAIEAQNRDAANWTAEDLRSRARRGLEELYAAGCRAVRTHVDWTIDQADPSRPPLAWQVLGELAEEWRHRLVLQRAALLSIDDFDDAERAAAASERVAMDGGILGAFVFDHDDRRKKIECMFDLARRYDLPLDFHVDEGLVDGLDGLAMIARAAIACNFTHPVLCSHACSLMNLSGDELVPVIDRLLEARISIACLPTTNLYLQSRGAGTPDRRGITRVNELAAAGVNIVFGSDNVRDAFCPVGFHDPLRALSLGVLAAHLEAPLGRWLPAVTDSAAGAIGLAPTFLDDCPIGSLLLAEAEDTSALLASMGPLRRLAEVGLPAAC